MFGNGTRGPTLGTVPPHSNDALSSLPRCRTIIERYIPKHLRQRVRPEDIARKHRDHSDLSEQDCNDAYMAFIRQWPLYGSTIFDVLQGYTTTLPKNLWLAVNQYGIHILKRRDKEPLVSYEYKDIVNYRYAHTYVRTLLGTEFK